VGRHRPLLFIYTPPVSYPDPSLHLSPSSPTTSSTPVSPAEKTWIQQVVGSLLFYARALDLSVLTAVCQLSSFLYGPATLLLYHSATALHTLSLFDPPPSPSPPIPHPHHRSSRRDAVLDRNPPTLASPELHRICFYLYVPLCYLRIASNTPLPSPCSLPPLRRDLAHLPTLAPPPDVEFTTFACLDIFFPLLFA
jgi:hypothetical protein